MSGHNAVQHNKDRYVAIELAGVMREYLVMPCKSLEDRMRDTLRRYDSRINAMIQAHQGVLENACLDEIAKLGPLYPRADTGEVERLARENKMLRSNLAEVDRISGEIQQERDTLRAQLAERGAQLQLAKKLLRQTLASLNPRNRLATYIRGFLKTASAEPSAPVEIDERAVTNAFHDWAFYKKGEAIGRMDGQQAALEGFIAGADWQARAALERKP